MCTTTAQQYGSACTEAARRTLHIYMYWTYIVYIFLYRCHITDIRRRHAELFIQSVFSTKTLERVREKFVEGASQKKQTTPQTSADDRKLDGTAVRNVFQGQNTCNTQVRNVTTEPSMCNVYVCGLMQSSWRIVWTLSVYLKAKRKQNPISVTLCTDW